jgi:hypothetical protein
MTLREETRREDDAQRRGKIENAPMLTPQKKPSPYQITL